jgi:hypothetical protein
MDMKIQAFLIQALGMCSQLPVSSALTLWIVTIFWAITDDRMFTSGGIGWLSTGLVFWNGTWVAQPPQWIGHAVRPENRRNWVSTWTEGPYPPPPPTPHKNQTRCGVYPVSRPIGKGVYFTVSKAAGAWGWPLSFICLRILRKYYVSSSDCKCRLIGWEAIINWKGCGRRK